MSEPGVLPAVGHARAGGEDHADGDGDGHVGGDDAKATNLRWHVGGDDGHTGKVLASVNIDGMVMGVERGGEGLRGGVGGGNTYRDGAGGW
jgi:hypothetical protein